MMETELEETEYTEPKKIPLNYDLLFSNIFVEVFDIEKAFDKAITDFTNILLKRGIQANPKDLYSQMDMMLTRLMKIYVAKRMCVNLGLHEEANNIIANEMELVYRSKQKAVNPIMPISGEHKND
jgi:hypothetical protein